MEKICLNNIVPSIFSSVEKMDSGIWRRDVVFQKEKSYLIEAASGTGKSSLISFIYGYRKDYEGKICFDETDVRTFTGKDWTSVRQNNIGLMFQELRLFPELTAGENVILKNNLTAFREEKQIRQWFEMLGIDNKWSEPIGRMSFGQQQRVAFIRALCQPFDFIFLDEPVSHLDDGNARAMANILQEEMRNREAGIVVTSIGKHFDLPYDNVLSL